LPVKKRYLLLGTVAALCVMLVVVFRSDDRHYDLYGGQPGEPLAGLSAREMDIFRRGKTLFEHQFTPDEGLGPLFNARSCYECHGKPLAAGLPGQDRTASGSIRMGTVLPHSPLAVDLGKARQQLDSNSFSDLLDEGGPIVRRRSVTREFPDKYPPDCQVEPGQVSPQAMLTSFRYGGPLLGGGLIDAIEDRTIANNMFRQAKEAPDLVGRTNPATDPLTLATRVGRFGWKCQSPSLLLFTAQELNNQVGVTTLVAPALRGRSAEAEFPRCLWPFLPAEPNDVGKKLVCLSAFQALLGPPSRHPLTAEAKEGERLFTRLRCAVCHTPVLYTAPIVEIADPDSPFPNLQYMEVRALENQPVRLYSDLLLHDMGPELADGIAQGSARGGEWRTTPLWGIRNKKFFLHNGSARSLDQAIQAHGGQAEPVKRQYLRLSAAERQALLKFVGSL
jgi:CxxC motif-containing protein (DUF1111 family)